MLQRRVQNSPKEQDAEEARQSSSRRNERQNSQRKKNVMPKLFCSSIYVVHTDSFFPIQECFFSPRIQWNNCQVDSIITDDKYKYGFKIACFMLVNIYSREMKLSRLDFIVACDFPNLMCFFRTVYFLFSLSLSFPTGFSNFPFSRERVSTGFLNFSLIPILLFFSCAEQIMKNMFFTCRAIKRTRNKKKRSRCGTKMI